MSQTSIESLLFPCMPVHEKPPGEETDFFSPVELLQSSSTKCKAKFFGGSSSWCQTSRLGNMTWGSELSFLWENLYDIVIFQFVGHSPSGYEICLCCKKSPSYSLIVASALSSYIKYLVFGSFQYFLLIVVQHLVVILVFSWRRWAGVLLLHQLVSKSWIRRISILRKNRCQSIDQLQDYRFYNDLTKILKSS